jgi:hypothetical protein
VSDHPTPLSQRVRRLLGTGSLAPEAAAPEATADATHPDVGDPYTPANGARPPGGSTYSSGNGAHPPIGGHLSHHFQRRPDTGALFESQIARLSGVLRELHAIDRAREAELRQLRERLAIAEAVAHAELLERIVPAVAQLDALIGEAARLLQPAPEPPPTATLFERMRVRAAAVTDQTSRESLVAWASSLLDLRTQLASLIDQ